MKTHVWKAERVPRCTYVQVPESALYIGDAYMPAPRGDYAIPDGYVLLWDRIKHVEAGDTTLDQEYRMPFDGVLCAVFTDNGHLLQLAVPAGTPVTFRFTEYDSRE